MIDEELPSVENAAGGASNVERRVMPDDMLLMENASGENFALKFNPDHQQHGWIFYNNHGTWVTLRRALPQEMERAERIINLRRMLLGEPCKG